MSNDFSLTSIFGDRHLLNSYFIDCDLNYGEINQVYDNSEHTFTSSIDMSQQPLFSINNSFIYSEKNSYPVIIEQEIQLNSIGGTSNSPILEKFKILIETNLFLEAKEYLDSNLAKISSKGRLMSLSLLRLELFKSLRESNYDKIINLHERIKDYDDDFAIKTGFLEVLIQGPELFKTSIYLNKVKEEYVPAIFRLSLHLLLHDSLLQTFEFSDGPIKLHDFSSLENMEQELVFYAYNYFRVYSSFGDYDEVYLNCIMPYSYHNKDSVNSQTQAYLQMVETLIKEQQEQQEYLSKRALLLESKSEKKVNKRERTWSSKNSYFTFGSDETSDRSKCKERVSQEKLYRADFNSVNKQTINQKNMRFFKKYLKNKFKSKEEMPNSFVDSFCSNRLNPPLLLNNLRFRSHNKAYMHWLLSSENMALLYNEYIQDCFYFVFESIVKAYKIENSKDLTYLSSYLKETASLYCQPLSFAQPTLSMTKQMKKQKSEPKVHVSVLNESEKKPSIFKIECANPPTDIREAETSCSAESLQVFEFEIAHMFGNDMIMDEQ